MLQNSIGIIYIGKAVPFQAWTGPEGSRKLRFPDFVTTVQDGGRLSALRTGRLYPRKYSRYSFLLEAESIVRSEGFYVNEKSTDTSWDRTSDLPICAQHLNHCPTAIPISALGVLCN